MKLTRENLPVPNDPTPWLLVQPNDDRKFCVLWLQGWTSTIEKHEPLLVRLAQRTGLSLAILNYAGHGNHPIPLEETTREQQFGEALFAYETLKKMGYEHIIVAGTSFGGYLTALLTEQHNPYAVILRAPAVYEDEEFTLPFAECEARRANGHRLKFRSAISSASSLDSLEAIRNYSGWTYVIEHELDSTIPKNIPHSYFEAAQHGNYLIIPGTDHSPSHMPEPEKHFAMIELTLASVFELIVQSQNLR